MFFNDHYCPCGGERDLVFQALQRLQERGTWEIRYYDSLEKPGTACNIFAHTLLCVLREAGMGVAESLPEPYVKGG